MQNTQNPAHPPGRVRRVLTNQVCVPEVPVGVTVGVVPVVGVVVVGQVVPVPVPVPVIELVIGVNSTS